MTQKYLILLERKTWKSGAKKKKQDLGRERGKKERNEDWKQYYEMYFVLAEKVLYIEFINTKLNFFSQLEQKGFLCQF